MFRRDDGGHHSNDAGPYNPKYLDMAMHGDIYSLGETTRTLQKNYEPVPTGSKEYNEVVRNMEEARKNINFDSCNASTPKGLWVNLDKKD